MITEWQAVALILALAWLVWRLGWWIGDRLWVLSRRWYVPLTDEDVPRVARKGETGGHRPSGPPVDWARVDTSGVRSAVKSPCAIEREEARHFRAADALLRLPVLTAAQDDLVRYHIEEVDRLESVRRGDTVPAPPRLWPDDELRRAERGKGETS